MSLDDDINILSQASFFDGISAEQLRLLAFGADSETLFAGAELFLQDAQSDCGYVVVSGLIDLSVNSGGVEKILGSVEPGGLVGELALITDNQRATNAVARRDTKLLRIPRVLFMRMLDKYPETAYDLHQKIARSVRSTILQLEKIQVELDSQSSQE
jgi:CRP-like cAMP-binding protein